MLYHTTSEECEWYLAAVKYHFRAERHHPKIKWIISALRANNMRGQLSVGFGGLNWVWCMYLGNQIKKNTTWKLTMYSRLIKNCEWLRKSLNGRLSFALNTARVQHQLRVQRQSSRYLALILRNLSQVGLQFGHVFVQLDLECVVAQLMRLLIGEASLLCQSNRSL